MNGAFELAAISLQAQQRALDVIANNVANVNTNTFKRSDVSFSEVIAAEVSSETVRAGLSVEPTLSGVAATVRLDLDEQGELQRTGRALDVAVEGRGFIALMGPGGQTLLWRGGSLNVGEDGALVAANGLALRTSISVPLDATAIEIGADGVVRARSGDDAESAEIGRLMLVRVDDSRGLERLDGGLYRVADGAEVSETIPGEDGAGVFVQGALERSNVDLNREMVQLLIVQRAYAASAQVVQAADQLMAITNGLRR